ncbi:hypothetical protein AXA44_10875 [Rhodococcus sp. SC4]|nr:hypothetical protein AXA44_10875 [Rhodococcus sp. SC4]
MANLTTAKLIKAELDRADFTNANLTDANLTESDLTKTDLTSANLDGANLTGANLTDANLSGTNLTGANLTNAELVRVYGLAPPHSPRCPLLQRRSRPRSCVVLRSRGDAKGHPNTGYSPRTVSNTVTTLRYEGNEAFVSKVGR